MSLAQASVPSAPERTQGIRAAADVLRQAYASSSGADVEAAKAVEALSRVVAPAIGRAASCLDPIRDAAIHDAPVGDAAGEHATSAKAESGRQARTAEILRASERRADRRDQGTPEAFTVAGILLAGRRDRAARRRAQNPRRTSSPIRPRPRPSSIPTARKCSSSNRRRCRCCSSCARTRRTKSASSPASSGWRRSRPRSDVPAFPASRLPSVNNSPRVPS